MEGIREWKKSENEKKKKKEIDRDARVESLIAKLQNSEKLVSVKKCKRD